MHERCQGALMQLLEGEIIPLNLSLLGEQEFIPTTDIVSYEILISRQC